MSSILETNPEPRTPSPHTHEHARPLWPVVVLLIIVGAVAIYAAAEQHRAQRDVATQMSALNAKIAQEEARVSSNVADIAAVGAQTKVISDHLGLTQQELHRAQVLAARMRQESQQQLVALNTTLEQVQKGVADEHQSLAQTQTRLDTVVGDLGQQSGLIARNHEELQQLRASSARNYVDFSLNKTKEPAQVGPVAVSLKSADVKNNRFTLVLTVDDNRIEKKDRTLLEPIQFYRKDGHQLYEIVVYKLGNHAVDGYLSEPKQAPAAAPAAG